MYLPPTDPRRWPFSEMPAPLKIQKPYIHPEITGFNDLPKDQKSILYHVKSVITQKVGECQLSLFGSRIHGNWDDESDYDILIHKEIDKNLMVELRNLDYGAEVDLSYTKNPPTENHIIF